MIRTFEDIIRRQMLGFLFRSIRKLMFYSTAKVSIIDCSAIRNNRLSDECNIFRHATGKSLSKTEYFALDFVFLVIHVDNLPSDNIKK